jgi:hypothetical protein
MFNDAFFPHTNATLSPSIIIGAGHFLSRLGLSNGRGGEQADCVLLLKVILRAAKSGCDKINCRTIRTRVGLGGD